MDLVEKTKNINRHPWELSRADNIIKILKNQPKNIVIADVGSGDQYFTKLLTNYSNNDVIAVDKEYIENQSIDERIKCFNDIDRLVENSIDYIFLMDVLEHINTDLDFLKSLSTKLKTGGRIIITVPAWQKLFSKHDVYLQHFRRYSFKQLSKLVSKTDLKIVKSHYFYSILIPLRILSLLIERIKRSNSKDQKGIGSWKYGESSIITKTMYTILNLDFRINQFLNKTKIRMPGLSLFAVVIKEN